MKIVVDSNRVIASLAKDSTTRNILLSKFFEFFAPEFIKDEINKYKYELSKKARLTLKDTELLISFLLDKVNILKKEEYFELMDKIKGEISDDKDLPYIAVSLYSNAEAIWTHDLHFKEQTKIKVFTNIDMLRLINQTEN